MSTPEPERRLSRFLLGQLLDLILGIAVTAAIFGLFEASLMVFGSEEGVRAPRHLSAGFDPSVRLFEADPENPGGFVGANIHKSGPVKVPARTEKKRVMLFGGSNTARLHERTMRVALGKEYEVVNLGVPGFGSTRVAILFREALERFDPDLVVLYSGHNEFVEKSFAMDMEEAWENETVQKLATALENTRTGRFLTDLVQEEPTAGFAEIDDWTSEYKKFEDLGEEETLKVWDAYEENLRYMVDLARDAEVPMVLSTVVWNRLSEPRVGAGDRPKIRDLLSDARKAMPDPLRTLLPFQDPKRVHAFDWGRKKLLETPAVEPLVMSRSSHGWLADVDPDWPYERPWEPKVREYYAALEWLEQERTDRERTRIEKALGILEEAYSKAPEHCRVIYQRAYLRYALGERGDDLRAEFERAAALDRAPRKGTPTSNDRVRRVAADHPDVLFLDTDAHFQTGCADGMTGWEWMVDHCHINDGAGDAIQKYWAEEVRGLLE